MWSPTRYTERVVIDDVAIRGLTSLGTGWLRGIDLYNTQWFLHLELQHHRPPHEQRCDRG